MAAVLAKDVPDYYPSRTLIGAYFGWSTYTAISLTEDGCFLTLRGQSFWGGIASLSFTTTATRP